MVKLSLIIRTYIYLFALAAWQNYRLSSSSDLGCSLSRRENKLGFSLLQTMNLEELILCQTDAADLEEFSEFIKTENADNEMSSDYLRWWYCENTSESFSMWHYRFNGDIVGIATTNNFEIVTNDGIKIVAMPQKVLTAEKMRGKGLFGKLYWQTERDNLENDVDFFLTFTNEASTPIFLQKFGYLRGICPDVIFVFSNPTYFLKKSKVKIIKEIPKNLPVNSSMNAIKKNYGYLAWRYSSQPTTDCITIEIFDDSQTQIAIAFLKRIYKKKIPILVLMDLIALDDSHLEAIMKEIAIYATRKFAAGFLVLQTDFNENIWQNLSHKRISNRFNFLVKGKSPEETESISKVRWNFSFGDLDFL